MKHKSSIIVQDFNSLLSVTDRTSREKISKYIIELDNTINQCDIIDTCRTLHSTRAEYKFFSSIHGTFIKIGHILDQKFSHSKFGRTQVIEIMFSYHDGIILKINNRDFPGGEWLGLCTPAAGGMSSIPGQGTKIPEAAQQSKKIKYNRKEEKINDRSNPVPSGSPTTLPPPYLAKGPSSLGGGRSTGARQPILGRISACPSGRHRAPTLPTAMIPKTMKEEPRRRWEGWSAKPAAAKVERKSKRWQEVLSWWRSG